jgi:hypothetical protein
MFIKINAIYNHLQSCAMLIGTIWNPLSQKFEFQLRTT